MLISRGFGILVPVIPLVYLSAALAFLALIEKAEYLYFSFGFAMALTSATLWLLGKKVNSPSEKVLIDPETNKESVVSEVAVKKKKKKKKNKHTLFWIPMHWFAFPAGILAILFTILHFMIKQHGTG